MSLERPGPENHVERSPNPSEHVFSQFYRGTAEIPQAADGMRIYTINALLDDAKLNPNTITDFANSKLSEEQVNFLVKTAEQMHTTKDITGITSQGQPTGVAFKVRPEFFAPLYNSSVNTVTKQISTFYISTRVDHQQNSGTKASLATEFFSQQQSAEFGMFEKLMKACKEAMATSTIKDLLKKYRTDFKTKRGHWETEYKSQFTTLLIEALANKLPDINRKYIESFVKTIILEEQSSKYSEPLAVAQLKIEKAIK